MLDVKLFDVEIPLETVAKIRDFEQNFSYPLDQDRRFSIQHPDPYLGFMQAIGHSACIIATDSDSIQGIVCVSIRDININEKIESIAYVSNLKINPLLRYPLLLPRLLRFANEWMGRFVHPIRNTRCKMAYSVVMHGNARHPDQYSGRLQIPKFTEHSRLRIALFPCNALTPTANAKSLAAVSASVSVSAICDDDIRQLSTSSTETAMVQCISAFPSLRSHMKPICIRVDAHNYAVLEDTRAAKQLFTETGEEIRSLHLTHFHCNSPLAVRQLIKAAQEIAQQLQFKQMFLCLNAEQDIYLSPEIRQTAAWCSASVYTHAFPHQYPWSIHSSEI